MNVASEVSSPRVGEFFKTLLLMCLGATVAAIGVNGVIVPMHFLSGGITGFCLNLHYVFPEINVGLAYAILNIPVFIAGWFFVGRRFFFYSLMGVGIFSLALSFIKFQVPVTEMVPAAIIAGILLGLGSGITLRSAGSAGGTDVISIIFAKKFSIKIGSTVLALNILALLSGVFIVDLNLALYTLIHMFVTTKVVDLVVSGLSKRRAITIVSKEWDAIRHLIINDIGRGGTVLEATGGYAGVPGKVLYTVVTFREMVRLKELVKRIDPNAFLVVADTVEVMGWRIGNQPHW
ncbi:MAG: YitT family protein [Deltaproteobacteria bacterium]|nr:MAG: YitT family protein [Deltaproteobacteria bacterium]